LGIRLLEVLLCPRASRSEWRIHEDHVELPFGKAKERDAVHGIVGEEPSPRVRTPGLVTDETREGGADALLGRREEVVRLKYFQASRDELLNPEQESQVAREAQRLD